MTTEVDGGLTCVANNSEPFPGSPGKGVCSLGFYTITESPLTCSLCHKSCLSGEGPNEDDCITCHENAEQIDGAGSCRNGFVTNPDVTNGTPGDVTGSEC